MIQGNEYLGTSYRLLCTPITTRYFVFISSALRETSSVLFKTNPSHDYAGDVFEEFSSLCGMTNKRIYITPDIKMQMLMQCLNGAALANIWIIFEHIDRLNNSNLQMLTKEIQMVQQQFLIAEIGNDNELEDSVRAPIKDKPIIEPIPVPEAGSKTLIEKSGVGTYSYPSNSISESAARDERPTLKYPNTLFVVMASLSPNKHNHDSALLGNLQLSFRCMEMLRPDIKMIATVMLIRESFRNHQSLSLFIMKFVKNLIERVDSMLSVTRRDVMMIVLIAKKFRDVPNDMDLEDIEVLSVVKACRLLFSQKIISVNSDISAKIIEETIQKTFKIKQIPDIELNELRKGLEKAAKFLNLSTEEWQLKLCEEIYLGLRINRGIFILGPEISGKNTCIQILSKALQILFEIYIKNITINPNIFTPKELFGSLNAEKVIKEGIVTKICEEFKDHTNS